MTTRLRRTRAAKLGVMVIMSFIAIVGLTEIASKDAEVSASATGPTPSHTNAPLESNCTACHGDFPVNTGTGNILISALPANYLPGQQIPITVTVNQNAGVAYGFQMTGIDAAGRKAGTFVLPSQTPQQLQIVTGIVGPNIERSYIEHTVDGVVPTQFNTKSWTFSWTAPPTRVGKVSFYAAGNGANSDGTPSGDFIYTTSGATLSGSGITNFVGDGVSDVSVYRPSTGFWYALDSTDGSLQAVKFGIAEDIIVPGDYDGDGKTDRAVWRPSTGTWFIDRSSGGVVIAQFGLSGDIPVPGDYDGDLKNDFALWRPSAGVWYIIRSSNGTFDIRQFGSPGDKTVQADFDADGKTDLGIFRPSTGFWYIWRSSDSSFLIFPFGLTGDLPAQGDYDGDGKADPAVFRPSNATWYIDRSSQGSLAAQFGLSTDKPVPADFDGDGKWDIVIFRNGLWYILRSSDSGVTIYSFGLLGDVPVPAGYLDRQ